MGTITLKKIPDNIREEFNQIAKNKGLTQDALFLEMWGKYNPKKEKSEIGDTVKKVVQVLIERNNNAANWYEKRFLTPSLVSRQTDIISSISGGTTLNKASINAYFEAYKAEIEIQNAATLNAYFEAHKDENPDQGLSGDSFNMKAASKERRAKTPVHNEPGN